MDHAYQPLVSCLCVTGNRHAFLPWLLWNFDKQDWPRKELVIIDGSRCPLGASDRSDIRIIGVNPDLNVAAKRNLAMHHAAGEVITWFDDDDWQHPKKISQLLAVLQRDQVMAGCRESWFMDLDSRRCRNYRITGKQVIFNSAAFIKKAVMLEAFPENCRKASDTHWMRKLAARYPNRTAILDKKLLFFWLSHKHNLSNPSHSRSFPQSLRNMHHCIEQEDWGQTDRQLEELTTRLSDDANMRVVPQPANKRREAMPIANPDDTKSTRNSSAISVMIKATAMDTPYLDVMVRHMLRQAKYDFSERVLVVERCSSFRGKYRHRSRSDEHALSAVLDRLQAEQVIDRVIDVDQDPDIRRTIMQRYFAEDADRIPTHAVSGGPIYATLFGMEQLNSNNVLQMDADVFFHSGEKSWVSESLAMLKSDPTLWLMMTHPGPPAGPPGSSLGSRNARIASWDARHNMYRFSTATTRYFLCDRQRLHGKLRYRALRDGCAPLEQLISDALRRHRAFRGALGHLGSWHLHAWFHGDPFPEWSAQLAKAIENGAYPAVQKGEYDLRLDNKLHRSEWLSVLRSVGFDEKVESKDNPGPKAVVANGMAQRPMTGRSSQMGKVNGKRVYNSLAAGQLISSKHGDIVLSAEGTASFAVVIPIRNRAGCRLRNTLHSLVWQSIGSPQQIFVVSHGSRVEIDEELAMLCREVGATLLTVGSPDQPWNKPLALNVGIRAASSEVPFIMVMDADIILAPNFLEAVAKRLQSEPPALVLCRILDLPKDVALPGSPAGLLESFEDLRKQTTVRPRYGTGAIQASSRSFFFNVRGYDEDFKWWGAMDGDMVQRAKLAGLQIEWIEDRTAMLHQWHPRKHRILNDYGEITQARKAWSDNHRRLKERSCILVRNPNGWGIC